MRRRRVVAAPIQATLDLEPILATLDALDPGDITAMADPEDAHSPMSPDDNVSNEHEGLHTDEHSTHGNTPSS